MREPSAVTWFGQREAMTRGERPFRVRAAVAAEDQHLAEVDEPQRGSSADDVLHQARNALCVIDHRDTLGPEDAAPPRFKPLPAVAARELERCEYTDLPRGVSR